MNWDPSSLLLLVITWTVTGTIVLLLTEWLTRSLARNAALRHLAWTFVFCGIFLMPLFQVPDSLADNCHGGAFSWFNVIILGAWFAGTLFFLGRFILAWIQLRSLRAHSSIFDCDIVDDARRKSGVGHRPRLEIRIAHTARPSAPITWGLWKEVVCLPKDATDWTDTRLAAVLLHELGHVRRRDHLAQIFAFLICAVHWFNPIFWRAARKMEAEAEIAADDCAILSGIRPSTYAAELLQLASQLAPQRRTMTAIETSMVKTSSVENRIHSIIDPASPRGRIGFWRAAFLKSLVLLLLLSAGFSMRSLNPSPKEPVCLPQIVP